MGLLYIVNESTFKTDYGRDLVKRMNPMVVLTTNHKDIKGRIDEYLNRPYSIPLLQSKSTYENTITMLEAMYKVTEIYNTKTVLKRHILAIIADIHFEEGYITKELLKPKLIDNGKFRTVVFKLKPIFEKG